MAFGSAYFCCCFRCSFGKVWSLVVPCFGCSLGEVQGLNLLCFSRYRGDEVSRVPQCSVDCCLCGFGLGHGDGAEPGSAPATTSGYGYHYTWDKSSTTSVTTVAPGVTVMKKSESTTVTTPNSYKSTASTTEVMISATTPGSKSDGYEKVAAANSVAVDPPSSVNPSKLASVGESAL